MAQIDSSSLDHHRQIIGIIACLERFLVDANEAGNAFLLNLLEKQRMRLKGLFDRHVVSPLLPLSLHWFA